MFKGKTYHLGYYDTVKEAAEIRKIAEKELFGKAEKEYNEQAKQRQLFRLPFLFAISKNQQRIRAYLTKSPKNRK